MRALFSMLATLALASGGAPAFAQSVGGGGGSTGAAVLAIGATQTATGAIPAWNTYYDANCAASCTLTLPAISAGNIGQTVTVVNVGTGAAVVSIAPPAGATFDAVTPSLVLASGQRTTVLATSVANVRVQSAVLANGYMGSFVDVMLSAGESTNVTTGTDRVKFNTIVSSAGTDIAADISTAYTSTANVNSLGRFTLQPGRTYIGECDMGDTTYGGTVGNWVSYAWFNADTNVILQPGSQAFVYNTGNSGAFSFSSNGSARDSARMTFTPTVATRVECKITAGTSFTGYSGGLNGSRARATIQAISTTNAVLGQSVATLTSTTITDSQTTTTAGYVNTTGGVISIPSAGTWLVQYNVPLRTSAAGTCQMGVFDTNAGAINPSSSSWSQAQTTNGTVMTGQSFILTTTAANTLNLRWNSVGGVTCTIFNNSAVNGGGSATFIATQIGTSSIMQFTGATAGANGQAGFVPQPLLGQQGRFLRGDGTWAVAGSAVPTVQTFTTSGTYTPTAGMRYVTVQMVGAGGGGGASAVSAAATVSVGSGGGSGGYVNALLTAAQVGASQTITIGAGGASASSGASSTFGALLTAGGGGAGGSNVAALTNGLSGGNPGAFTVSTGTNIASKSGEQGGGGSGITSGAATMATQGIGGNSELGRGGSGFSQGSTGSQSGAGSTAGANTGGGGGGAISAQGGAAATGGGGGSGLVVITEYF